MYRGKKGLDRVRVRDRARDVQLRGRRFGSRVGTEPHAESVAAVIAVDEEERYQPVVRPSRVIGLERPAVRDPEDVIVLAGNFSIRDQLPKTEVDVVGTELVEVIRLALEEVTDPVPVLPECGVADVNEPVLADLGRPSTLVRRAIGEDGKLKEKRDGNSDDRIVSRRDLSRAEDQESFLVSRVRILHLLSEPASLIHSPESEGDDDDADRSEDADAAASGPGPGRESFALVHR